MITIKDFEVPEDCRSCPLAIIWKGNPGTCRLTGKSFPEPKKRHPDCPLQEDGCDICKFKHRCTRRPAGDAIIVNCFKFKKEEKENDSNSK